MAGEIIFYQSDDGTIRLETRLENETLWLTQQQMAELFQTTQQNISQHISNIYVEGELTPEATHKKILWVRQEGNRQVERTIDSYNLDMVLSVGYRVKSLIATRFRIWATRQLKEYIIKGFVMDDERLKLGEGGSYFDELLARIRDIRSSEKIFWRKVLDVYATSIDYDPKTESSRAFFRVIQNKMHWAAHGQTAAEVIFNRAGSDLPNMGLTNWVGDVLRKKEVEIAKNYLNPEELNVLNRIVTLYLEYAELQALNREPMTMRDWIDKLDDFLRLSGRDVLAHAGTISHEEALQKAHVAYEKFSKNRLTELSRAETDFLAVAYESTESMQMIEQLEKRLKSAKAKERKHQK